MIKQIFHNLLCIITRKSLKRFLNESKQLKKSQLEILKNMFGFDTYEDFVHKYPVTNYEDYQHKFEEQRQLGNGIHFVPTSGSTQKIKWIPYTPEFKKQIWNASAAWLNDLYVRYPNLKSGTHFWSLSWLPDELRENQTSNDLNFFGGIEKYFLSEIMTIDESVALSLTIEESMQEMLISLLNKKVTLISVWSPTFMLELLDFLLLQNESFLLLIHSSIKRIAISKAQRGTISKSELVSVLFPDLVLISAWDTSMSSQYAQSLKTIFKDVAFEGKGVWTTEGVITIPINGCYPLAYQSHFYEFEDAISHRIYPSWELILGQKVKPILSAGNGLTRYRINDLLEVNQFLGEVPCFHFIGRDNEIDLVGEKISAECVISIFKKLEQDFLIKTVCILAIINPKAQYALLIEDAKSELDEGMKLKIAKSLDNELCENFHFKLARELHQLDHSVVISVEDGLLEYIKYSSKTVKIRGNIKIEPIIIVQKLGTS